MNRFITLFFCLSLLSLPAAAQERELKSGLNYTTMARPQTQEATPAKAADVNTNADEGISEKAADPATTVWNKYKELATGQAATEKTTAETKGPSAPEKPSVQKPLSPSASTESAAPQQQSAFGAILDEWKSSKDTQREMRSKSFSVPTPPAKETTEDAKDPS